MNDVKRVPLTPARKKRRRRKKIVRISIAAFFVIFFVAAFLLAFRIPQIQISSITVQGNNGIATEDIQAIAHKDLEGNYYFIFPKSNIFLYPKKQISNDVHAAFNQVGNISVTMKSLSSINITLNERKPSSLWCADSMTCYFMDDSGFIFALAPTISGTNYIKYYGVLTGNPVNKTFLSPNELSNIKNFIHQVSELGFNPVSITALNSDEYNLKVDNGGSIYFESGQTTTSELSNLALLLKQDAFKHQDTTEPLFNYIDLRYGNKLVYKISDPTISKTDAVTLSSSSQSVATTTHE